MANKWQRVQSRQEQDIRAASRRGRLLEPKTLIRKLSMVWQIDTETVISVLKEQYLIAKERKFWNWIRDLRRQSEFLLSSRDINAVFLLPWKEPEGKRRAAKSKTIPEDNRSEDGIVKDVRTLDQDIPTFRADARANYGSQEEIRPHEFMDTGSERSLQQSAETVHSLEKYPRRIQRSGHMGLDEESPRRRPKSGRRETGKIYSRQGPRSGNREEEKQNHLKELEKRNRKAVEEFFKTSKALFFYRTGLSEESVSYGDQVQRRAGKIAEESTSHRRYRSREHSHHEGSTERKRKKQRYVERDDSMRRRSRSPKLKHRTELPRPRKQNPRHTTRRAEPPSRSATEEKYRRQHRLPTSDRSREKSERELATRSDLRVSILGKRRHVSERDTKEGAIPKKIKRNKCPFPGCEAVDRKLKRHVQSRHIPALFHDLETPEMMASSEFHGRRLEALEVLARLIVVQSDSPNPEELRRMVDGNIRICELSEITPSTQEAMRKLCFQAGWEVPEEFTLRPINSPAVLIHWRPMAYIMDQLSLRQAEMMSQRFGAEARNIQQTKRINRPTATVSRAVTPSPEGRKTKDSATQTEAESVEENSACVASSYYSPMETETTKKTSPAPEKQVRVESNGQPIDLTSLMSIKVNKERGIIRLVLTPDKSVDLDYQGTLSPGEQGKLSKVEEDALLYSETDQAVKSKTSLGRSPVSQLVVKPRTYSEALKAPPAVGVVSPRLSPVVERSTLESDTAKAFDSHFHPDRLAFKWELV